MMRSRTSVVMDRFEEADRIARTAVERGQIPGVALHVRAEGRVVHERAFGVRRSDEGAPLALTDIFPVASLTKPVVAVGALQLCEQGVLRLDDPIARYLPEFASPTVLVSYNLESRALVTRPARRGIVVRDLLTHTSGIHHGFPQLDDVMGSLYERAGVVHGDGMPMAEKVKNLGPLPLVHDPGETWTYGLSSDVAGRLLEVLSGEPLDRFLSARVFEPLGMTNSFFRVPVGERPRLVSPHTREPCGLVPARWARDVDGRHLSGGGGLHTTVGDYGCFVQSLLDGGAPLLTPASIELMLQNHIGDAKAFGLRYGLGVGVATDDAPGESPLPIGGFGWYGIYSTWFWALPRWRTAVLFFANVLDPTMNLPLFARVVAAIDRA